MRPISIRFKRWFFVLPLLVMMSAAGVAQASPAAFPPSAQLTGVSCASRNNCVAVGWHTLKGSPLVLRPLAEAWNGRGWRVLKAPVSYGALRGVSCPGATFCLAVGQGSNSSKQSPPLAAVWNGTSWRVLTTPPSTVVPGAVSCARPGHCMVTGGFGIANPLVNAVVESWNGTSWHVRASYGQSSLDGVACPDTTSCLAVGSFSPAGDSWVPFAAAGQGRTWRQLATPPGDTGNLDTNLWAVSCATATDCMAVGDGMLVDQWTGSGWKQLTPLGAGQFLGVSCPAVTACLAVGQTGQTGQSQAAAQAWNGTAWRTLTPVLPSQPSTLAAVACPATAQCMAVGYYGTAGSPHTLAERWNGTGWTRLKTAS